MDKKELAAALEEIQSYRNETKIILESLKELQVASDKDNDNTENESELARLRKIVGDYHPSSNSRTYKEILKENQNLKQEADKYRTEKDSAVKETKKSEEKIKSLEKEVALLRKSISVPAVTGQQDEKDIPSPAELTDEEQIAMLRDLLIYDQRYSDSQVEFLTREMLQGQLLPKELLRIANPRLTVKRMEILCKLQLAQRGARYEPYKANGVHEDSDEVTKTSDDTATESTGEANTYMEQNVPADAGKGQTQRLKSLAEKLMNKEQNWRR